MFRTQRVLFPVDSSDACRSLVPTIRKMIESWDCQVVLLSTVESRQSLGRRHALDRLLAERRAIEEDHLPSGKIQCRVEQGPVGGRIVDYARSHDVDLVVLSAGGSTTLYAHPIGDVADQVLQEVPCPVWLDWGSARSRPTAGMYAHRVACVLDFDDSEEFVVGEAAGISQALEAELTLIHAVNPAAGIVPVRLAERRTGPRNMEYARWRIERLRKRFSPAARVQVECGPNHAVVSRILQGRETGLLVTGNCRETILAAEGECPVLRLATPATAAWAGVPRVGCDLLRKSA